MLMDCVKLDPQDLKADKGLQEEFARACAHAKDLVRGASEANDTWHDYAAGVYLDHIIAALLDVEVLKPEWAAHDEYTNSLGRVA